MGTIKIQNQAVTIPASTELASPVSWSQSTAMIDIMTHTVNGTGAPCEVLCEFTAIGMLTSQLTFFVYHNGTLEKQQVYSFGGVLVFSIGTAVGTNTIELKAQMSVAQNNPSVRTAYIRTLETKK